MDELVCRYFFPTWFENKIAIQTLDNYLQRLVLAYSPQTGIESIKAVSSNGFDSSFGQ